MKQKLTFFVQNYLFLVIKLISIFINKYPGCCSLNPISNIHAANDLSLFDFPISVFRDTYPSGAISQINVGVALLSQSLLCMQCLFFFLI